MHTFLNDLERSLGTYLYGCRMYEVLVDWETAQTLPDQPPYMQEFAEIWRAADKVVYSKTLETGSPPRRSRPGWSTSATCSSRPSW